MSKLCCPLHSIDCKEVTAEVGLSWSVKAADVFSYLTMINSSGFYGTEFSSTVLAVLESSTSKDCLINPDFFFFLCRKQKYGNKGKASVLERFPQGHPQTFPWQEPGDTAWGWGRRKAAPAGEVGEQDWLSAVRGWWIYWFRQCLAVSVSLLQKWRRWVFIYFVLMDQSVCLMLSIFQCLHPVFRKNNHASVFAFFTSLWERLFYYLIVFAKT